LIDAQCFYSSNTTTMISSYYKSHNLQRLFSSGVEERQAATWDLK